MARQINARIASPTQPRSDGGGVDHNMWVDLVDLDDSVKSTYHSSFPISTAEMQSVVDAPTNERVPLYKALILEYFGTLAVPLPRPIIPTPPINYEEIENYWDDKAQFDIDLAAIVEQSTTLSNQANAFIESRPSFTTWDGGFNFVLQVAD